jgi:hypothetical protein
LMRSEKVCVQKVGEGKIERWDRSAAWLIARAVSLIMVLFHLGKITRKILIVIVTVCGRVSLFHAHVLCVLARLTERYREEKPA